MSDSENNEQPKKGFFSFLEEKQSQIATVLIGVLLVIAGALTYNYFKTISQPKEKQGKISFGEMITPSPAALKAPEVTAEKGTVAGAYIVKSGDSLWKIAEEKMGSGFAWKDLAKANNIAIDNPILKTGQVLHVPETGKVASGATTVKDLAKEGTSTTKPTVKESTTSGSKLPATYTVVRGDNLWKIAQKLYGDGNKWHLIFDYAPNRLSMYNPDGKAFPLIHSGNILTIPALPAI